MEEQVQGIIVERKVFSRNFLVLFLSLYVVVVRLDVHQHLAGVHSQYATLPLKGFPDE
jgi:hypothetical protein